MLRYVLAYQSADFHPPQYYTPGGWSEDLQQSRLFDSPVAAVGPLNGGSKNVHKFRVYAVEEANIVRHAGDFQQGRV